MIDQKPNTCLHCIYEFSQFWLFDIIVMGNEYQLVIGGNSMFLDKKGPAGSRAFCLRLLDFPVLADSLFHQLSVFEFRLVDQLAVGVPLAANTAFFAVLEMQFLDFMAQ